MVQSCHTDSGTHYGSTTAGKKKTHKHQQHRHDHWHPVDTETMATASRSHYKRDVDGHARQCPLKEHDVKDDAVIYPL